MVPLGLWALGCSGGGASASSDGGDGGDIGASSDGGADSGACTDFVECDGGSVVGTWRIDPRCVLPTTQLQAGSCPGEFIDLTKVVSDETWTLRADLSTTVTLSAAGPASAWAPEACLVSGGAPIACADAGSIYASEIDIVGAKPDTATCQSAGGICTCAISVVADPVPIDGTYSVAGSKLFYSFDGNTISRDYCATATVLTTGSPGAIGPGSVNMYEKL